MLHPDSTGSRVSAYSVAVLVALCYTLYLFPADFIAGNNEYWNNLRSDAEIAFIGMRYFLADEWYFPLFQTRLLVPPEGINIIYTDSVPLFALAAKVFRDFLPYNFNYFGLYYVFIYVMQAVMALYLARSLEARSPVAQATTVILALLFPTFLFRTSIHASLTAHFLVLWALGLYFTAIRNNIYPRTWVWFTLATCMSLLVHAYLFLIVFAIHAACAIQHAATGTRQAIDASIKTTVLGLVAIILMWVSGYFGGIGATSGFGHYSMNLLSPFLPQRSGIFTGMQGVVDATGGQKEGFNYLGLGVIIVFATALFLSRNIFRTLLRRYWALWLVLAAFFFLSLSNRIFIGDHLIFELGLDTAAQDSGGQPAINSDITNESESIEARDFSIKSFLKETLQQFRSSGRFFWPIGYLILAGSVVAVSRKSGKRSAAIILVAATAVQLVDTGPLRNEVREKFSAKVKYSELPEEAQFTSDNRYHDAKLDRDIWRPLIAAHERLTIIPGFECAGLTSRWDVLDLIYYASFSATTVNTAYLARRTKSVDCGAQINSISGYVLEEDEILVILSPPAPDMSVLMPVSLLQSCKHFAHGMACTELWDDASVSNHAGYFSPANNPAKVDIPAPPG